MSVVQYTVPAHTRTYKSGKTVQVAEFVATRVVQSLRRATDLLTRSAGLNSSEASKKMIVRSRHIAIGREILKKYQAKKTAKKIFIASLPPIEYNYSLMNDEKAVFTFECDPEPIVVAPEPVVVAPKKTQKKDLLTRSAGLNSSEASKKKTEKKTEKGIFVHYDCYHFDYEFIRDKFSSDFTASEMKDILRKCRSEGGSMVHSFCPSDSPNGYTYNEGFIFEGVRGRKYIATCYGINTSSPFSLNLAYRRYDGLYDDDDDEYNPSTFYSQADFKRKFGCKIPDECDLQTRSVE